ncbi:hypothetical protein G6F65_020067 [Rhizopus arrhizus]|nr:hypothetical protein G6F65_020067 [Rhizopus arrhizus]
MRGSAPGTEPSPGPPGQADPARHRNRRLPARAPLHDHRRPGARPGLRPRRRPGAATGPAPAAIETASVPVDAQPGHVPAAVVGVTDAEDHERSLAHRIARAPVEGESAALGEDVARRVPGQHAIVFPLDRLATYTVVDHRHLVAEVRYGLALCCRSLQAVVGFDGEEQGGS